VFGTDVHPDHHNLLAIPTSGTTYKILNASDGGIFISNSSATPGVNQGDWTMVGRTYNTSQFYGADKRILVLMNILVACRTMEPGGRQPEPTLRTQPIMCLALVVMGLK
jgi:hypothetical protein